MRVMMAKWLFFFRGLSGVERGNILIAIVGSFLVAAPWLYDVHHRSSHVAPHGTLFLFGAVVCVLFYWTVGASLEIVLSCFGLSVVGDLIAIVFGAKVLYGLVPLGLWDCWLLVFVWRENRGSLKE